MSEENKDSLNGADNINSVNDKLPINVNNLNTINKKSNKNNKATGIIYAAINLLTNKVYVGQTRQSLNTRIKKHYYDSKHKDYKFSRALKKYHKQNWQWIVLDEVSLDKLNETEEYYIKELNSFKSGYNSLPNSNRTNFESSNIDNTIYKFYHPEFGTIESTKINMVKTYNLDDSHLYKLVAGKYKSHKNWICLGAVNNNL